MVQDSKRNIRKDNKIVRRKPLFRKIWVSMIWLLILEIALLWGSVFGTDIISNVINNQKQIIDEKVISRGNYLQNEMIANWMNVGYTAESINRKTEELIQSGDLRIEDIGSSVEVSNPLLVDISDELISMMRSNRVTGAFVILNRDNLEPDMVKGEYKDKTGIYIRDIDPLSRSSHENKDLLLERGSADLVRKTGITTDASWSPKFDFGESGQSYYDFLYKPYQAALENRGAYDLKELGYWSGAHLLYGENREVMSYSIPLILSDGTVYGVMGIDITVDYLQTMLSSEEIACGDHGAAYMLLIRNPEGKVVGEVSFNSSLAGKSRGSMSEVLEKGKCYTYENKLDIYSRNGLFAEDHWTLIGAVPDEDVTAFAQKLEIALLISVLLMLVLGVAGTLVISYRLVKPISALSREVRSKNPRGQITLQPTGIREIDQLAGAIETLSTDVMETGEKFTQIIEMASIKIAGFQIDLIEKKLFVTKTFFGLLGHPEMDDREVKCDEFIEFFNEFEKYVSERDSTADSYVFKIPEKEGFRYVGLRYAETKEGYGGLLEDVTHIVMERKMLKHERDHDPLTNLYNRRAFARRVSRLFSKGRERLKVGALIMMDLDNLKHINDTYGHGYGDNYITAAASAIQKNMPETAIISRISGDEFNVFLHGYDTEEEISDIIHRLEKGLEEASIELPGGVTQGVKLSGGVAWYPKDGERYETLFRYADYAMYMVKHGGKGQIGNFDLQSYENDSEIQERKAALNTMIETQAVRYAFQPILDTKTGEIFAYEALMRPAVSQISSVVEALELARMEGKLNQIEEITWFKSLETFKQQIEEGQIGKGVCMFINSIPNQKMNVEKEEEIEQQYKEYLPLVVMELIEEEQMPEHIWESKKAVLKKWGARVALDDYGTGYNSESILINVSPDFIKVDIAIVKNIHMNADKQAVVEYIVHYAHLRGKGIVAEGVEIEAEAEKLIQLGVDYIQGYYVAKPDFTPPTASKEALELIKRMK